MSAAYLAHFSGAHALVLGGSSELGAAITTQLQQCGLHVQSTCRHSGKPLFLDLHDNESIDSLLERMGGTPHYVVDCLHSHCEGMIAGLEPEEAAEMFYCNCSQRMRLLHKLTRAMLLQRQGRMVFISSTAAALPNVGQGGYAATKQAVEALYANIGIELSARGITTCSLRLGYVDAGRGRAYIANAPEAKRRIPAGRVCRVQEVAGTVAFLLSDAAQMFNATSICMDGGLTACK